jgi:hypothetical protein
MCSYVFKERRLGVHLNTLSEYYIDEELNYLFGLTHEYIASIYIKIGDYVPESIYVDVENKVFLNHLLRDIEQRRVVSPYRLDDYENGSESLPSGEVLFWAPTWQRQEKTEKFRSGK